ncbi:MAG: PKD domain-containing protein, partial [Myxococcota bacterium]
GGGVLATEPYLAEEDFFFFDDSTPDPDALDTIDPITNWDWDFGGFGASDEQNPADPVAFDNTGDFVITLTVTTDSGQTDTFQRTVSVVNPP